MKYIEIKKKTKDELVDLLKNLKKESYNLRFQKKNGQLEKDIARIKTKLNDNISGASDAKKSI